MAAIKQIKFLRHSVRESARHLAPYVSANPDGAEAFSFEIEESNLVKWIHHPETVIKLEAIDDPDGIA